MIIEVVGGYVSNSIAIMTDAAHMFSDVTGFGISIIAIRYGLRSPNTKHSYGYHRSEVIGALCSIVIIWVLVLWLIVEAINRMYIILYKDGYEMDPEIMVATAIFGLCCNIANLIALGECSCKEDEEEGDDGFSHNTSDALVKAINNDSIASSILAANTTENKNLNVRAAMIHMIGDLIQSIGVIIAGLIIYYYPEYKILDPILTFMFSIIVFTTTI
jgi:zinc transporter 2